MRTLLTFILLLAVGITEAAEQRFVPYNPATGATLGGIVYTNGTFTGNGSGLTNLNMTNVVGSRLDFGEGATITRGPGEVFKFSTEIVGAHVGAGDQLTNLNASNLSSGTVPEARLSVYRTADLQVTNSLTIYPDATPSGTFAVMTTNSTTPTLVVSSNRIGVGTAQPKGQFHISSGQDANLYGNNLLITHRQAASWATSDIWFGIPNSELNEIDGSCFARLRAWNNPGVTRGTRMHLQTHGTKATNWNPGIFLNESGNVGIGTTNPAVKLDVGGTATASNFVATAGGLTLPVLSAAPAVSDNNAVLWISNSAPPALWITTTNGTFAH